MEKFSTMNGDSAHAFVLERNKMTPSKAIARIEQRGILLVYPLQNQKEPPSLWSEFYPRSKMKWEWDTGGADNRVAELWHLRAKLSSSSKVVYAKWFQGRATFFSCALFPALVAYLGSQHKPLSPGAKQILHALEENSPLSTKALKQSVGVKGKVGGKEFEKSLKELWSGLWIVGFGEVDDGAFPSLAIGATSVLFDTLWTEASQIEPEEAGKALEEKLGADSKFFLFAQKARKVTLPLKTLKAGKQGKSIIRYEDLVGLK
jgi:hypothetical protein